MQQFYLTHTAPDFLSQVVRELVAAIPPGNLKGKLPSSKQLSEAVRSALPERAGT